MYICTQLYVVVRMYCVHGKEDHAVHRATYPGEVEIYTSNGPQRTMQF